MDTTSPEILERSGGVGIHWNARLTRKGLPGVIVHVNGSATGYFRTGRWYARMTITVPPGRNRQPPPSERNRVNSFGQQVPDQTPEYVTCTIYEGGTRIDALAAGREALMSWDIQAKLDARIEQMWASDYRAQCLDYLKLNSGELWEARIEAIRRVRQLDAGFAELFPEPPVRE